MALKKNIVLKNDLQVKDAYIRIDTVSGSKDSLNISVNSYVSQDAFNNGKGYLEQNFYTFTPSVKDDSANFIKQGYEFLKSLTEYNGSVDVLE
ncbi:MAG TPA: hypothetical protein DEA91_04655 [Paenibacillus sp.]|nr:hypothetical protein [Paenibacillus sp.]